MINLHRVQKIAGNVTLGVAGLLGLVVWAQAMLYIQEHGEAPPKAPMVLLLVVAGAVAIVGLQLRITAGRTYVGASRWMALVFAAVVTLVALRFLGGSHWSLWVAFAVSLAWLGVIAVYSGLAGAARARAARARVAASQKASRAAVPFVTADTPIADEKEERLGRMALVRILGRRLASYNGQRSLVVALCGPWGSGKTSLAHLVIKEIERLAAAEGRFVLGPVHLAPGVLGAGDDLAPALLQEIGRRVKASPSGNDVDIDVGEQLIDVATTLAQAENVVRGDTQVMTGEYMLGDVVRAALAWVKGHTGEETLDVITARVSKILTDSGGLLVVSLDDLDRLTADQMASVGRVMNFIGGFANTVYLCEFDRERVERTLEHRFGDGNAVLDRAMHLTFDLPAPDPLALRSMVLKNIHRLRGNRPTLTLDAERMRTLWKQALVSFVHTGRDVAKIFASYDLALDAVGATTEPIDLLALEAMRVMEPLTHRELGKRPECALAGDQEALEAVLATSSERHRDAVQALLAFVFPAAGADVAPPQGAAHAEHFAQYFRWSLANEVIQIPDS
jgi:hypothetical protein